jgi:hypothetical protein
MIIALVFLALLGLVIVSLAKNLSKESTDF